MRDDIRRQTCCLTGHRIIRPDFRHAKASDSLVSAAPLDTTPLLPRYYSASGKPFILIYALSWSIRSRDSIPAGRMSSGTHTRSYTTSTIRGCASPLPLPRRRIWRETDIWLIAPACVSLTASAIPEAQHIPCDTLKRKDSPFTASETVQVLERSSFGSFFSRKRN